MVKVIAPFRVLYAVLLCTACEPRLIAAVGSPEPPFRYYTVVDGLTQSEVYDIEQDPAGYLWFTTARGLNRYDGKDFDHYTIADGLPSNELTALSVAADGSVWIGDARGGITLMRASRVVATIDPQNDKPTPILDIEMFDGKTLAVAEGIGILEISQVGGEFVVKRIGDDAIAATDISVFEDNAWVAASTGLFKMTFDREPQFVHLLDDIKMLHNDAAGTLWLVDGHNRIGVWQNDSFEIRAAIESEQPVVSISTDSNGTVWAATSQAIYSFDGQEPAIGLASADVRRISGIDEVSSVFVDREDSLWLSSRSRLYRYLGDRFSHYKLRTGNEPETVWAITEDKQGRFWFATQAKLLIRQADESIVVIGSRYGVPVGTVRDIVRGEHGDLWFGVAKQGLFRFDTDRMRGEAIAGTEKTEVLDVAIAADGAVWFSTMESGVFRYSPTTRSLTKFSSPGQTSVYSLDTWSDGSVWYGADEVGLVQLLPLENGRFVENVFNEGSGLRNRLFNHVNLVGPRQAWVATEEGGLYFFDDGAFRNFGKETPLADQTVYLVEPLQDGTVVVGGEQGLYQFIPGTSGIAHYNQLVGFVGLETNVHATYFDAGGRLWIGTVDGATRMDTSLPMPRLREPTPTIITIETELDRTAIADNSEVDPDQLGVHVEFAAISLLNPRGIEYSYRLVGTDSSWGPPTTNRNVSYPRIPPGSYEFMVRARYPGGDWGQTFASHRFTVLPFFWQKPWFALLCVLIVAALFRVAMVYRTRNIEWLNETLREQVRERTQYIEKAKQNLERSNEQLSREIEERQKSDKARVEIEARFRRAFENAPIGMGLLDAKGMIFDANPALRNMFWPDETDVPAVTFAAIVNDDDRDRFCSEYRKLATALVDAFDEKLACADSAGNEVQAVVNLSPVRSDSGEFLYAVLQVQDVTESMKLTVQLEYQASYDELTGLLNRRAFEAELSRAWERGTGGKGPSYLMFMDLDQFKVVNDTSGHIAGDRLLRDVSEILVDNVRANDVVARLGGDEFGIILWECPQEVAARIAESIRAGIADFRFHWDTEVYRIGVSIGGLPIDPVVGDISELQQLADAACYAAKEAGRNRVHMVAGDKDSARAHRGQVRWVQRIREAMDNNRFAIYGQVIKPLNDAVDEPERVEILLRLRDPETRKLVPPGAFLPAAERYGLSVELDQWVVSSLLNTLFVHQAFQAAPRTYWINLSGTSIGDKRFATFLKDAIRRSPLPPGTINFEITETAVIRSVSDAGKLMASLREMGCKFALDDFGSGLSSFGYLKNLPIDYVKIDGMFIRDILRDETDRIFVKSIIDIARSLKIKTIAEFVENAAMLNMIRELGADYAQGFFVGRPFVLAPRFPGTTETLAGTSDPHLKTG